VAVTPGVRAALAEKPQADAQGVNSPLTDAQR